MNTTFQQIDLCWGFKNYVKVYLERNNWGNRFSDMIQQSSQLLINCHSYQSVVTVINQLSQLSISCHSYQSIITVINLHGSKSRCVCKDHICMGIFSSVQCVCSCDKLIHNKYCDKRDVDWKRATSTAVSWNDSEVPWRWQWDTYKNFGKSIQWSLHFKTTGSAGKQDRDCVSLKLKSVWK